MAEARADTVNLPQPTAGYAPSTFLERGVVVPFTTPQLAGARVRPAARGRLELIVANPSGARGVYILPWHAVSQLCAPTVHDRQLNAAVEQLPNVTPAAIRAAALEVAAGGLAGREAAAAAQAANAAEARLRMLTNFELLMMLMRQVMPEEAPPVAGELEARAKAAVAAVAPRLQLSAEQVAAMLEQLAALYAPIGVGVAATQARIPAAMAQVMTMRTGIQELLRGPPPLQSPDAELVMASADLTLACARITVGSVLDLLADMPALLRRRLTEPEPLAAKLARPEWLLDGWERICLVWCDGSDQGRDAKFAELADLVPATPREVSSWVNLPVESTAGVMRRTRRVQLRQDWRNGSTVQDEVARNEKLLALSLGASG